MKTISKDTPLNEITLRRYEKPYDLSKRDLVRKLCLSVGLLQPGDSRDIIVDVLYVLMEKRKAEMELSSENVKDMVIKLREKQGLALNGIASSNIRRQIKRLRDLYLVEKTKNRYKITEFGSIKCIVEEKVEKYLLPSILVRVKEYLDVVDKEF